MTRLLAAALALTTTAATGIAYAALTIAARLDGCPDCDWDTHVDQALAVVGPPRLLPRFENASDVAWLDEQLADIFGQDTS